MKLIREEHGEAIKRYSHIKPAPRWGMSRCSARCPGTERSCTLARDHRGPHVSHGSFKKVLAVWDAEVNVQRPTKAVTKQGFWDGGPMGAITAVTRGIVSRLPPLEESVFIILFLGMVLFILDWTLRILGLR